MTRPVQFTRTSAERIAAVVRAAELTPQPGSPLEFDAALSASGKAKAFRVGTISATWNKGATATVTQINGDGTAISGNPTFTAKNWFATVTVTTGTKKVACAPVGDTWILIAAECG